MSSLLKLRFLQHSTTARSSNLSPSFRCTTVANNPQGWQTGHGGASLYRHRYHSIRPKWMVEGQKGKRQQHPQKAPRLHVLLEGGRRHQFLGISYERKTSRLGDVNQPDRWWQLCSWAARGWTVARLLDHRKTDHYWLHKNPFKRPQTQRNLWLRVHRIWPSLRCLMEALLSHPELRFVWKCNSGTQSPWPLWPFWWSAACWVQLVP